MQQQNNFFNPPFFFCFLLEKFHSAVFSHDLMTPNSHSILEGKMF